MTKFQVICSCIRCRRQTTTGQLTRHHSGEICSPERRKTGIVGHPRGMPAWNKGLSKDSDERVRKNGETVSKTVQEQIREGTYVTRSISYEARMRLSESQSLNNRGGKSKWFCVSGQRVQGTWERDIAQKFTDTGILWEKVRKAWRYEMDGKVKHYTPDFYLPEYNIYLEVKGHWWGNDREKMRVVIEQYPHLKIIIVEKEQFDKILQGELVW